MKAAEPSPKSYWNPYFCGFLLGLTLLASFLILGAGLGASGALARFGAFWEVTLFSDHALTSEYFSRWGRNPLSYYLVFMVLGVFFGGLVSAIQAGRRRSTLEKGAGSPAWLRITLVFIGGVMVGFASRLARGCTSGQALTGGAMLLTGSMVFLACVFVGGYAFAYFVRSQWND